MKRRVFLSLAPAVLAAKAVPASVVAMPTIQEQMDNHAMAICALIRPLVPEGAGSLTITLGESWPRPGHAVCGGMVARMAMAIAQSPEISSAGK